MKNVKVSIVIPCHNETDSIIYCLDSLLKQDYKNIEIIVVDDVSEDNTAELVKEFAKKHHNVKLVQHQKRGGEGASRNSGVLHSTGEIIFQIDGDAIYNPAYVSLMLKPFEDPQVGGTIHEEIKVWFVKKTIFALFYAFRRKATATLRRLGKRGTEGAWAIRRSVFEKIGLYDATLNLGVDVDFSKRMRLAGYKIAIVPNAYFYHKDQWTFKGFVKRMWFGAVCARKFEEKWQLTPRGSKLALLLARNVFASLLPVFLVLSFFNPVWLIAFFAVFLSESVGPIVIMSEYRLAWKLAVNAKEYKFAVMMPLLIWLAARITGYGRTYIALAKKHINFD